MKRMTRTLMTVAMGALMMWTGVAEDARAVGLSCDVIREHVDAIYGNGLQRWKAPLTYRVDYHYTDTPLTNVGRVVKAYLKLFEAYSGIEVVEQPQSQDQPKFQVIVTSDFAKTFDYIRPRYEAVFEQGQRGAYQKLIDRAAQGEMQSHIMMFANPGEIGHVLVLINPDMPPEGYADSYVITNIVSGLMFSTERSDAYGPSVFNTGIVNDVFYPLPPADLELLETLYDLPVSDVEALKRKLCARHRTR